MSYFGKYYTLKISLHENIEHEYVTMLIQNILYITVRWFFIFSVVSGSNLKFHSNNDNIIVKLSEDIISQYFNKSRCVIFLSQTPYDQVYNRFSKVPLLNFRIISQTKEKFTKFKKVKYSLDELLLHGLNDDCDAFFISSPRRKEIILNIIHLYRKSVQRNNRKFIFLPLLLDGNLLLKNEDSRNFLNSKESKAVPDVLVCRFEMDTPNINTSRIQLITYKYTGEAEILLNIWSFKESFWFHNNIFPDKTHNLNGKDILLATFDYHPYGVIDLDTDPPIYDGTEMRLGFEFSKWINASYKIIIDAENEWGEIWDNDTGNGLLGNVVEDKADLGFAAIYLWYYEYQHLDFSVPYIRTGITCIAPRPQKLPSWMTVLLPFSMQMWGSVGGSLLLAIICHLLFSKAAQVLEKDVTGKASLEDSTFFVLGLLLLQTPDDNMRVASLRGPNRHHVNWLHFMFMLVTSAYAAGLASVLTVPRYMPPIDTVEDLAVSNIHWAATHEAWIFSLREATDPLTVHVYKQFRVMKEEQLKQRAKSGDLAFSIERLPAGHYAIGSYITEETVDNLRLMKQDIYWEQCVTVTRKGSPFMEKLNTLIHRLLDSGLLLAWEGQVVRRFLPNKIQRAVHQSAAAPTDHEPTKLKTDHIQGSLFILLFGFSLSLIVFTGEVIIFRVTWKFKYRSANRTHNKLYVN